MLYLLYKNGPTLFKQPFKHNRIVSGEKRFMRWFKHDTKFRKDTLATEIRERFGRNAVLTYIYLMEVLGEYKKTTRADEVVTVKMPMSYWLRELDLGYNQARCLHKLLQHLHHMQCVVFTYNEDMRIVIISNYVESFHSHPERKKELEREREKESFMEEDTGAGKERCIKIRKDLEQNTKFPK